MKEIEQIYYNDFGMSFHWKKDGITLQDKVQVIFRETGFYLTSKEITEFSYIIDNTAKNNCCTGCGNSNNCSKFLLKTPFAGLDMAVSQNELAEIKDLIHGTLFKIQLNTYLSAEGRN